MTDTKAKGSEEFEISKKGMFVISCYKNQPKTDICSKKVQRLLNRGSVIFVMCIVKNKNLSVK